MKVFDELFYNQVLWTAVLAWALAQVLKVVFVLIVACVPAQGTF